MLSNSFHLTFIYHCALQNGLDHSGAARFLAAMEQRTLLAYGILVVGIASELTAVQNSRLLLTCKPYMPDFIELCIALLEPKGTELVENSFFEHLDFGKGTN